MNNSSSENSPRKSPEAQKADVLGHKLFVTKLDGKSNQEDLRKELQRLFSEHGKIDKIMVKNSRNAEYSFAFVEYMPGVDGHEAVKALNGIELGGRKIVVEFQDNAHRRKDKDQGCYICGKFGHFARECRERRYDGGGGDRRRRRSYSRSRSRTPKHDKRRRSRSHKSKKQKRRRCRSNEVRRKDKRSHRSPSSRS